MVGAFRHRNYRLYFAGHLISAVGWWMHQVAQPWLVLTMTGSAFYVGVVSALGTLPVTVFSLVGGVVADRFPRRGVVLGTQTAAMLVALALATVVFADVVQLWQVMVAALLFGLIAAFDIPTRQAFLVDLVGKRDLMNAIALNSSSFSASRVVGPAIGGAIITAAGVGVCFLVNGLSYLGVITALLLIRVTVRVTPGPAVQSTVSKIREGLAYVVHERRARTLLVMLATASVFGFSFQTIVPVFIRVTLGRGAEAYGWALSAAGGGALIGALTLTVFARRLRKGLAVIVATAVFGAALVALGFVRSIGIVLVLLMITGMTMVVQTATTNTLLQILVPDELRGRIVSVYTLAFLGLLPFGSFLAGSVAERFGSAAFFVGGGVICASTALLALRMSPRLRATG